MGKSVWLINLYGVPSSPSSLNPDNSLAALAGSLKKDGYRPLILDYQTSSFCCRLIPDDLGRAMFKLLNKLEKSPDDKVLIQKISDLNEKMIAHQLQVIDELALELVEKAKEEKPIFIGFKLYSGEGNFLSRHLAKKIKQHIDIPLVGGGPLIRILEKNYLRLFSDFDYLLNGEVDRSIVKMAQFVESRVDRIDVPGLIFKEGGEIMSNPQDYISDLNELAPNCYDQDTYPALYEENEKILVFQVDESRGCPNQCNFCIHPVINGRASRVRSVKKVLDEIAGIIKKFGSVAFRFTGSNTPKKFLLEFSKENIRRKLGTQYSCYASINTTSEKDLAELVCGGLRGVFIGVETIDNNILEKVMNKKGQDYDKVKSLLKKCLDMGIYTTTSWIYPSPESTIETMESMRDFIVDIYKNRNMDEGSVMVVPSCVIPNTTWYFNPEKFGFKIPDKDYFLKKYSELILRLWLPRSLIGDLGFEMNGKSFTENLDECDVLNDQLSQSNIPTGITDDWMLQGKFSGSSMDEFKKDITKAIIIGDVSKLSKIVMKINHKL